MVSINGILSWTMTLLCLWQIQSCGSPRWYAVEQNLAEPYAYIHGSVFVRNDYIRVASVSEIDGTIVDSETRKNLKISTGKHQVKIFCDEAEGTYDSTDLVGKAKVLEFDANIQRTYKVFCLPYTHWWIEDFESGNVVAGERPKPQTEI